MLKKPAKKNPFLKPEKVKPEALDVFNAGCVLQALTTAQNIITERCLGYNSTEFSNLTYSIARMATILRVRDKEDPDSEETRNLHKDMNRMLDTMEKDYRKFYY
jgi:hypothetical protein